MATHNWPLTMKACQIVEFNHPYKIHSVSTPDARNLHPQALLVKVAAASYCHTDRMVQSGVFESQLPLTASHEGAGTVVAVGQAVVEFKPGDRVLSGLQRNRCLKCKECTGPPINAQFCANSDGAIGIMGDGAFAEYVVIDGREAGRVPENLDFTKAAPLACAGVTMWRALFRSGLKKGEWVAIVGAGGGLGHLGVGFAKYLGLMVVALDTRESALQLARECGADVTLDARDADVKDKIWEHIGDGVHATINLAEPQAAVILSCQITRTHGTFVQVAQPEKICIPFEELMFRDIRVIGTNNTTKQQMQDMLDAVSTGIIVKTDLFYGIDEISRLLDKVEAGGVSGKAVIVVDREQCGLD